MSLSLSSIQVFHLFLVHVDRRLCRHGLTCDITSRSTVPAVNIPNVIQILNEGDRMKMTRCGRASEREIQRWTTTDRPDKVPPKYRRRSLMTRLFGWRAIIGETHKPIMSSDAMIGWMNRRTDGRSVVVFTFYKQSQPQHAACK